MLSVPSDADVAAAQAAFAVCLFDELARGGVVDVVVCPGSRSTPLVLAALATPALSVHVRLDERSAGFFAIGRALGGARPVAIVVTSGTAAAELTPAVVEADLASVPLVVVTADRPPELRGVGAPQTIDQVKLYGERVRRYEDPGCVRPGSAPAWRPLAARLLAAAVQGSGPVHLNLPLVEPLDAAASPLPPGRADGVAWRRHHAALGDARHDGAGRAPGAPDVVAQMAGRRVVVVAGRGAGDPELLLAACTRHGWPVLADPLSGARGASPEVVASFDALLGDEVLRSALRPDVVVLLGAPPASKALAETLVSWAPVAFAVARDGLPHDPQGVVSDVVAVEPTRWLADVAARAPLGGPPAYLASWRLADDAAQVVFDERCSGELTEPALARALTELARGVPLVVSSSMPVRDVEWFGTRGSGERRVLANRGANGIDGVVSTALGVAAGGRAIALLGDLAFLHDAGSLADGVGVHGGACVLVVADNRGGGIFSFLPQRRSVDHELFERAFATPPTASIASVALGYGAHVHEAKDLDAVRDAIETGLENSGVTVVVCAVPDRDRNVELHRALADAARRAARVALGQ